MSDKEILGIDIWGDAGDLRLGLVALEKLIKDRKVVDAPAALPEALMTIFVGPVRISYISARHPTTDEAGTMMRIDVLVEKSALTELEQRAVDMMLRDPRTFIGRIFSRRETQCQETGCIQGCLRSNRHSCRELRHRCNNS